MRKFNLDDALKNIVGWFRWYEVQNNLPVEMFEDALGGSVESMATFESDIWKVKAADVHDILRLNLIQTLPGYSTDGSKFIAILDLNGFFDLMRTQPMKKVMLSTTYMLDQLSLDPSTQVCGLGIIEDLSGANLSMMKSLMKRKDFMELQKKKMAAMNDAYPFRFGEMWLLNAPWFYTFIWGVVKWFLKRKLRERIHLISSSNKDDMAKLRAKFDLSQLPVSLGGTMTEEDSKALCAKWVDEQVAADR